MGKILFTDGSVNTQSKIGYGAFLVIDDLKAPIETRSTEVQTRRYLDTSSTKLELQTLLWALDELKNTKEHLTIYTDSQNILGLPSRRQRFEESDYYSRSGKPLGNADLYRAFYFAIDSISCSFVKVKGHKRKDEKDDVDLWFTLVDRAAREALRATLQFE